MHPLAEFVRLTILGSPVLAASYTPHPDIAGQDTAGSVPAIHLTVTGTAGLITSIVLAIILLLLRIIWRSAHVGDASSRRTAPSRRYRHVHEGSAADLAGLPVHPSDPMAALSHGEYDASLAASTSFDIEGSTSTSTGSDVAALDGVAESE